MKKLIFLILLVFVNQVFALKIIHLKENMNKEYSDTWYSKNKNDPIVVDSNGCMLLIIHADKLDAVQRPLSGFEVNNYTTSYPSGAYYSFLVGRLSQIKWFSNESTPFGAGGTFTVQMVKCN